MSLGKRWKLPVVGYIALISLTVLLLRPGCTGRRAKEAEERRGPVLEGHRFPVQSLAFALDGTTLTSVAGLMKSRIGEVEFIVWDTRTGHPGPVRTESFGERRMLLLASDARTLVTAGQDHVVRVWDTVSGREQARLGESLPLVCALAFSGDRKLLATADHLNNVKVWEVRTGRLRFSCQGHAPSVFPLAFAPGGTILAGSCLDGTVHLWDAESGKEMTFFPGQGRPVWALAFSPDDRLLATGDARGIVQVGDAATRTARVRLATSDERVFLDEVNALVFSPDGRTLAVARGSTVQLWDVATRKRLVCFEGHEGKVICLAFAPDGTRLASGSYDKTVRLWNVERLRGKNPS
jgi:WD40 repeat protein